MKLDDSSSSFGSQEESYKFRSLELNLESQATGFSTSMTSDKLRMRKTSKNESASGIK